jgi:hypothetical protein
MIVLTKIAKILLFYPIEIGKAIADLLGLKIPLNK